MMRSDGRVGGDEIQSSRREDGEYLAMLRVSGSSTLTW